MANYSFFRQGPIIPQRENNLKFPDQYDINTTGTAKLIAKGVNSVTGGKGMLKNFGSPRIIDNTIRGYTAGLGSYATSAIDLVTEGLGLVDKKKKPAKNLSELPLLKAFLVSDSMGGKTMNKLYSEKDKLTREKGSAELYDTSFDDADILDRLSTATGEIGDITKEIRRIENDRTINPRSKRNQINALTKERNRLARDAMGK
jgi:hypothetical protein